MQEPLISGEVPGASTLDAKALGVGAVLGVYRAKMTLQLRTGPAILGSSKSFPCSWPL
jgi:hypothetical protein